MRRRDRPLDIFRQMVVVRSADDVVIAEENNVLSAKKSPSKVSSIFAG